MSTKQAMEASPAHRASHRARLRGAYAVGAAIVACASFRAIDVHGDPCGPGTTPPDPATARHVFSVSVRDAPYNAKGDAVADDTTGIQHALDDAKTFLDTPSAGTRVATVFISSGAYLVRGHLSVPAGVIVAGVSRAPGEARPLSGSALYAVEGAGKPTGTPFITLAERSTLRGVTIFYPEQVDQETPITYPWAIRAGGENVSIIDVALTNPWQGIDLASNATAGHLVQRVFGQAIQSGLVVDHSSGGGRLEDIHFWPFWKTSGATPTRQYTAAHGTAFDFRLAKDEVVKGVLEIGFRTGMHFMTSPPTDCTTGLPCGASSGTMTDINFDTTGISLDISSTDAAGWKIDGVNSVGDVGTYPIAIWHQGPSYAKMDISNAAFWGGHASGDTWVGLYQILRWDGIGDIALSSSNMLHQNPNTPAVDIRAGTAVIDGNYFGEGVGVAIASSGGAKVTATGNQMIGNTVTGAVKLTANAM